MVTVGMNYQVRPGKEHRFEQVFDAIVELIKTLPGHVDTQLFHAVKDPQAYLIISRWSDRRAFEAFIHSERFRKVTDWGREEILAARPQHEIYGGESRSA